MATTVGKYVAQCQRVVNAQPKYVEGKSSLTECDCIGMDKYAFRECGVPFSTTGTNYTLRHQVEDIRDIQKASDLKVGEVVFKYRKPGEAGYNLPQKYQRGGAEYNGDLNDYYHIGTVESVNPLRILHMTTPTAKVDEKIGKWGCAARWKDEYINASDPTPEPVHEPVPTPAPVPAEFAIVGNVPDGKKQEVNFRVKPSTTAKLIDRIPCGETVEVIDRADTWSKIKWHGRTGYMMTKYLIFEETEPDALYCVTIHDLSRDEAESIVAVFGGSITEERG